METLLDLGAISRYPFQLRACAPSFLAFAVLLLHLLSSGQIPSHAGVSTAIEGARADADNWGCGSYGPWWLGIINA